MTLSIQSPHPTMLAAQSPRSSVVDATIARRALDLARDERVSMADGVDHLRRLADGRHDALVVALREIGSRDDPDAVCARHLLARAIEMSASMRGQASARTTK